MKTLLIVRHAKSSWDTIDTPDIERPLNDRGKKDAPAMAKRVARAGIHLDRLVASPARRAKHTAQLFAAELGMNPGDIVVLTELYHAQPATFQHVISGLNDDDHAVAIFSHNPGVTAFVNTLGAVRTDNMPTCAVFAVKSDVTAWRDFFAANPQFLFFDYPKSGGVLD